MSSGGMEPLGTTLSTLNARLSEPSGEAQLTRNLESHQLAGGNCTGRDAIDIHLPLFGRGASGIR